MSARPVLIMAGGTGGHVFPALAVAEALRDQGVEVVWLGTRRGLESEVVPKAGFPMEWVTVAGLRGKGLGGWLMAPLRLTRAIWQALRVFLRRKPAAVLGMGGFVTGPGGVVAVLLRKPLLLHEQNTIPGLTNRLLARFADKVMEGFPGTFARGRNVADTGNPIRQDLTRLPPPGERLQGRQGPMRLLVIGGSLGALALNQTLPEALALMPGAQRPEVLHQTGKRHLESARQRYDEMGVAARVEPFIDDMAAAYGWADLVVCRAGALTVSELAAVGVAAILVPFPYAVDDHQTTNARYLADAGAAILIQQTELTPQRLHDELRALSADRPRLVAMAEAARALARPDATRQVADFCLAEATHV